jgi:hypothetical protein
LAPRIASQVAYHTGNAERSRHLEHRVHRLTQVLFATTLAVCAFHLAYDYRRLLHERLSPWVLAEPLRDAGRWGNGWLVVAAALLPALGAAFAGISGQAEFGRMSRRSAAMAQRLAQLQTRVESGGRALGSDQVGDIAAQFAEMMTSELIDWQVIFRAKSLEPL